MKCIIDSLRAYYFFFLLSLIAWETFVQYNIWFQQNTSVLDRLVLFPFDLDFCNLHMWIHLDNF